MALAIVHHPRYRINTARIRRFPVGKFRRIAEILEAELLAGGDGFREPEPIAVTYIALAHHPDYVEQVLTCNLPKRIEKDIGFPISENLVLRSRFASGGTLLTARLALARGIACNTAVGGHHAKHL